LRQPSTLTSDPFPHDARRGSSRPHSAVSARGSEAAIEADVPLEIVVDTAGQVVSRAAP